MVTGSRNQLLLLVTAALIVALAQFAELLLSCTISVSPVCRDDRIGVRSKPLLSILLKANCVMLAQVELLARMLPLPGSAIVVLVTKLQIPLVEVTGSAYQPSTPLALVQ